MTLARSATAILDEGGRNDIARPPFGYAASARYPVSRPFHGPKVSRGTSEICAMIAVQREEHRSLAPCHSAGATTLAVSHNVK